MRKFFRKWVVRAVSAAILGLQAFTAAQAAMPVESLKDFGGTFKIDHIRDGKVIGEYEFDNSVVDVGMNHLLDVLFNGTTQVTTWYMGLVDNAGFTAYAAGDTSASHAGWTEFTSYSEAVRQTWDPGSASARSLSNGTAVTFSINGTGTVKGLFTISDSTKSGTTGTLFSTASFSSTVAVINGDSLKVTYTVSG